VPEVLLVVNGERREVEPGLTIGALLASFPPAPDGRGVAVAVNGEVVPRGAWQETALSDGARVEIVAAVQGG
jgi:sulfur carrier protein